MANYYDEGENQGRRQVPARTGGGRQGRNTNRSRRPASSGTAPKRSRKSLRQREKHKVRKDVYITSTVVLVMFAALTIYTCVYSATNQQTLFENDYNGREEALLSKNTRGKIYADDGTTELAYSTDTKVSSSDTSSTESAESSTASESSTEGDSEEAAAELSDDAATREYPYSNLFSHVVGYAAEGGSGIELAYNYQLVHSDLTLSEKADYDNAGEKYPSNDVYTTLNVELQQAASDALGDNKGAVIVSDVHTGAILCMVSKPDFDPNTIEENWDSLLADSTSGTLVNRVSQGEYAPGSTFKIFDSIEFMNEDMDAAENYSFTCPGYITIDDETITCYHYEVHGTLDFEGSFAKSCNSSFANIGTNLLNRTSFAEFLDNCMFGEDLPFELPSNQSSYVLDAGTSTQEVMQLAIGQGQTLMSPLHLNMITTAIANGGTVYVPYVVDSVRTAKTTQNPEGKVLSQTEPTAYRTIMSEEIASKMRTMMRAVVEYGTASKIRERSYDACGKTGSAEYVDNETTSHAWFTGFAPYNDPEVAITVIVEGAGSGGTAAVPVARDVLDVYFGYTGSEEDQTVNWYTTDNTIAPSASTDEEDLTTENTISLNMDTNGDGVLDATDIDGDGVADIYDTDGNGIPDTEAIDGQAPAIETTDEAASDASSDSTDTENAAETDTTTWVDTDGDGIQDTPADEAAAVQAAEDAAAASSDTAADAASTAASDAAAAGDTTAATTQSTDAAAAATTTTDAGTAATDASQTGQSTTTQVVPEVTDPAAQAVPAAGNGTEADAAAAAAAEAAPVQ